MKVPVGFSLAGINCGIKRKGFDLGLICSCDFSDAVAFFTQNANPSYSVLVSKKNFSNPIKAVLVNSGNANCFSHKNGLQDTEEICSNLAKLLNVEEKNILIASTGIIGKRLPKEKIIKNLPKLIKNLGENIDDFVSSIMTTDTFKKIAYKKIKFKNGTVNILGFAKGAGMIFPNMATMLSFILTDIDIDTNILKEISKDIIDESFNSINVDACTSTNDTVFILKSNKIKIESDEVEIFKDNLKELCISLAKMIVKDAEGATKFIEIQIKGALTKKEAELAAKSISSSMLFKSAIYGENPNFGRIISALGQVNIPLEEEKIEIKCSSLKKKDIKLTIDLKRGNSSYRVYTCDLTPKYIKINADYS
jgi:glutamate N-acetyltransferase/amino-acid N-acetyltransferase